MLSQDEAKRLERIQRCLRSEDAKELIDKLNELNNRAITQLKSARELIDIARWQGKIEAFETVLKLREE